MKYLRAHASVALAMHGAGWRRARPGEASDGLSVTRPRARLLRAVDSSGYTDERRCSRLGWPLTPAFAVGESP